MPPRTKQQKHLQAARSRIGHEELKPADETPSCVHVSADQMVVSTLVSGSHPSMVRKIMLLSNVKPPSMATYYRAQNKIHTHTLGFPHASHALSPHKLKDK